MPCSTLGQVVPRSIGAVLKVLLGLLQPAEVKNLVEFCHHTPDVRGRKATVFHSVDDIAPAGIVVPRPGQHSRQYRIATHNRFSCAVDGQEAVEIFEKSAPDYFGVIYMDIMMPRMNGLDAARTIREMKRRDARRVPIIAMSANSFAEDIINSRLAGMNVHLAKPLDAEKMIIALKQCMADNSDVKLHEDL